MVRIQLALVTFAGYQSNETESIMRVLGAPTLIALVLLAGPALAQSTSTSATGSHQPGTSATGKTPGNQVSVDTQKRIRQSLEQSGFKNVQVAPGSFVVRAQSPDGSRVLMEVSPDHVAGVVFDRTTGSGSTVAPGMNNGDGDKNAGSGPNR
jgi:hypothetical protein